MSRRFAALALAGLLAGCATAGPDYHPPERSAATDAKATGGFASGRDPLFAQAPLPDHWWRLYQDPRLDGLIEQALAANADLRAAEANLRRADALVRETIGSRQVATQASGGVSLDRPADTGLSMPGVVDYDLGFSAAYPLDLNGKIRRAIEASEADRDAVAAARDAVRIGVAAAVARAYVDVCGANYQYAINRRVLDLQRRTLDATRRLQRGGRGTAFDVSRAQAAVDQSAAALPGFIARRQAGLYLLATLLGRPPADYPREAEECAALPALSRSLPIGDGAALIRRRPDIRQAERAIAADTARIGVAMADLYPQVSLGGSVGLAGPLKDVGGGNSFGLSLGPLISWTFPNRNIVRARIAAAGAQVDADIAGFDATVLDALRETETALETYARDRDRADALARARDSAALSASQANRLFRFGRSDFLALLDAQRVLASAEAAHAAAVAQLGDDQITLFLALGGGWN